MVIRFFCVLPLRTIFNWIFVCFFFVLNEQIHHHLKTAKFHQFLSMVHHKPDIILNERLTVHIVEYQQKINRLGRTFKNGGLPKLFS